MKMERSMIRRIIPALAISVVSLLFLVTCGDKSTAPNRPVLSVSPLSIDFGGDQMGMQFLINNEGETTLEWNIEDPGQGWYDYSPLEGTTGTETDTVEVLVDRSGLSGEFADTLTVSSNGGTAQVEILMQVPTSPTLSVYPLNLDFGVDNEMQFLRIANSGPGTLDWNISENIDWLELSPDSGSTSGEPDTVVVSIHRPNSSNDLLTGELMVSSNGGSHAIGISARDTIYADEGIYAFIILERTIGHHHMGHSSDLITARFDSDYSPCEPSSSLGPDSVYCSNYTLVWNADNEAFEYYQNMPRVFLTAGETYFPNVIGNSGVPSLSDSITVPTYSPSLSAPLDSAVFSRSSDITVEWTGVGDNQVTVSLISSGDSICSIPYDTEGLYGINITTENDGQLVILSSQISSLEPGEYRLILTTSNAHGISANGYSSESFVMAKSTSYVTVYLQ